MHDPSSLASFFSAWDLFRDAALAGALAGVLLGALGVYVVLRRMVFLSAALSQAAGLGVALTFYVHVRFGLHALPPTVGALATTLLASALLVSERRRAAGRGDTLLGLAYLVGAAGALAVGTRIVQEVQDVHTILFGSAVAVLPRDFTLIALLACALLGLHAWLMRGFIQVSIDRDGAFVRRLPVRLLDALLFLSLALAVSVCTRVLGALPVFAFSVLPAMAALRVVANVQRALLVAGVLGGASGFGGYLLAFRYQLPVGASQALLAAGFVVAAELYARLANRRITVSLTPRSAA